MLFLELSKHGKTWQRGSWEAVAPSGNSCTMQYSVYHEPSQAASFKLLVPLHSKHREEYIKELHIYEEFGAFKASSSKHGSYSFLILEKRGVQH